MILGADLATRHFKDGQAHGLPEATLATFYRIFGDVRPSEDVIRLLR